MNQDEWESSNEDESWVSKTQVKKEMHALQRMGEQLLTLNATQLAKVPLTDELLAAIDESKRIKSHEARRRHMQFIGRLMRNSDIEGIQHALDLFDPSSDYYQQQIARLERWRERIVETPHESVNAFLDEYPKADRQLLTQLARNATKELEKEPSQRKSFKKLFQYLKEVVLDL